MSTILKSNSQPDIERMFVDMEHDLMQRIRNQLEGDDINFTENLSKNIHTENSENSHYLVLDSPYSLPVEYGLPAGSKVNFDALKNWVRGKLGVNEEDLEEVTIKIFNKIKRKGIKPKRFVKKAIRSMIFNTSMPIRRRMPKAKKSRFSKFMKKMAKNIKKVYKVTKQIYKSSQVRRKY